MCHDQRMLPEASLAAMTAFPSLNSAAVEKHILPPSYATDSIRSPTAGLTDVPNVSQRTSADVTAPTDVLLLPFTGGKQ